MKRSMIFNNRQWFIEWINHFETTGYNLLNTMECKISFNHFSVKNK